MMQPLLLILCFMALSAQAGERFAGLGRPATAGEVEAWNIDVRPDFQGLPPGSGSVSQGQRIWESKCETCHGIFGEATDVFSPLTGGTSAQDQAKGRTATLLDANYPQRTTLMKLATLSTLWDYIRRAMPWNAPKSLSVDEVYAVTAYILHLGDILPADFVLSNDNIRAVQQKLPNRYGMAFYTPLWKTKGRGDTHNDLCMKNCAKTVSISSSLPDYARDSHGNLADQNRLIGPVRGANTSLPAAQAATVRAADWRELAQKNNCTACHQTDRKLVGPSFVDIARRYQGEKSGRNDKDNKGVESRLSEKIRAGGSGVWGTTAMPPNSQVSDADLSALIAGILALR